jgi:hypothetical protein
MFFNINYFDKNSNEIIIQLMKEDRFLIKRTFIEKYYKFLQKFNLSY